MLKDPRVDEETLRRLLGEQTESSSLDYKEHLDLKDGRHVVRLARHVGAMAAFGGHIVVGVDGHGTPTGAFAEADRALFDEATLRAKLSKYLPAGTALASQVHELDGHLVAMIAVGAHPAGICVMAADGNHGDKAEFRAGDVLVRRGTASVRWNQDEALAYVQRTASRVRDSVRSELLADFEPLMRAAAQGRELEQAPSAVTSWELDLDRLVEGIAEQVRRGDEVPLRRLLAALPRELARLGRGPAAIYRTAELLDRAAALMALFAVVNRGDLFELVARKLTAAYQRAVADPHPAAGVPGELLGAMQLERMYPVGALLVRERAWWLVEILATVRVRGHPGSPPFWLLSAQRAAERGGTLRTYAANRPGNSTVISLAYDAVARNEHLTPDLEPGDEALTTSLCEFDLLHGLAAIHAAGERSERLVPGGFAGWFAARTDPLVVELLEEHTPLRDAVFPQEQPALAQAIELSAQVAARGAAGFMAPWTGFEDRRIVSFLAEYGDQ